MAPRGAPVMKVGCIAHAAFVDGSELKAVQEAIFARNSRRALFPAHLFADPAWDILLVLYAGALEEEHCGLLPHALATTGLPTKSLLSWIDALVGEGLVASTSDRPAFFRLTLTALSKMETFSLLTRRSFALLIYGTGPLRPSLDAKTTTKRAVCTICAISHRPCGRHRPRPEDMDLRLSVDDNVARAKSRIIALRILGLTLRLMENWRRPFSDPDNAMIMLAIAAIVGEKLTSASVDPGLEDLATPVPHSDLTPCNISSIAAATGIQPRDGSTKNQKTHHGGPNRPCQRWLDKLKRGLLNAKSQAISCASN